MTLHDHINQHYKGNLSAYARDMGTSFTQVKRWVDAGVIIHDGQLFRPVYYTHNDTKLEIKA